ncbi:MAG: 16S rRNA (guanine(966)-N(2))-methyltransferase RsmD [Cryobacterium sp.]|nr:16S rRNA (guanine(966)-N(2))-methyltransferase RsmD [Cryobacterium sp.]
MTRIIAGFAGSLKLAVPETGTRPTSDRVREAIFSSLNSRLEFVGLNVLDLYAGSGALGLEAASRGASIVTFVEQHKGAARTCKLNCELVSRSHPANQNVQLQVHVQSVRQFLESTTSKFDLVFLDPPYELPNTQLELDFEQLHSALNAQALVVVERASRTGAFKWPKGFEAEQSRRYGDTTIWVASAG